MNVRKIFWLLLILALPLVLVACDDGGDDDENGGDAEDIELPQEASTEDGALTISLPEGWVFNASGFGEILVANSDAVLEAFDSPTMPSLDEGVAGTVSVVPGAGLSELGLEAGAELTAIVDTLDDVMLSGIVSGSGESQVNMGDAEDFTVGDASGAISTGTITDGEETVDAALVVTAVGDDYGLGFFLAAEDGIGDFQAQLEAIVASIVYEVPEADAGGTGDGDDEEGDEPEMEETEEAGDDEEPEMEETEEAES